MSTGANVQSTEAIDAVRRSLALFVDQVQEALAELEAEMRRMLEWLEHDRPRFWKSQTRLAHDQVHEAQQALHRCLMFPVAGERPSCYEERSTLKRAQARLAYCEEKTERVRHWQRAVQHELFEYEGRISQLVRTVEIDVPQAIGTLDKVLRRLDEYQRLQSGPAGTAYDDLSMARELWPADSKLSGETDSAATDEVERPATQDIAGQVPPLDDRE